MEIQSTEVPRTLALRLLGIFLEMFRERQELRQLGLTEEEIDGYFNLYMDNYIEMFNPYEYLQS